MGPILPMDAVRVVAAYAPCAFVRAARGPWVHRDVLRDAFIGWGTGPFMSGLLVRIHNLATSDAVATTRFARGLLTYHRRMVWVHPGDYTPTIQAKLPCLEWLRLWCLEVAELLPREYVRDRRVLGDMAGVCLDRRPLAPSTIMGAPVVNYRVRQYEQGKGVKKRRYVFLDDNDGYVSWRCSLRRRRHTSVSKSPSSSVSAWSH